MDWMTRDRAATEHYLDELGRRWHLMNMTEPATSLRLGLCCIFSQQPIRFRNTTVKATRRMERGAALKKLSELCFANAEALFASLQFCASNGIGSFRINSQILPLKTHPACGYSMDDLPEGDAIVRRFKDCGEFAKTNNVRTCFHPDQFVVLRKSPGRRFHRLADRPRCRH